MALHEDLLSEAIAAQLDALAALEAGKVEQARHYLRCANVYAERASVAQRAAIALLHDGRLPRTIQRMVREGWLDLPEPPTALPEVTR